MRNSKGYTNEYEKLRCNDNNLVLKINLKDSLAKNEIKNIRENIYTYWGIEH